MRQKLYLKIEIMLISRLFLLALAGSVLGEQECSGDSSDEQSCSRREDEIFHDKKGRGKIEMIH